MEGVAAREADPGEAGVVGVETDAADTVVEVGRSRGGRRGDGRAGGMVPLVVEVFECVDAHDGSAEEQGADQEEEGECIGDACHDCGRWLVCRLWVCFNTEVQPHQAV